MLTNTEQRYIWHQEPMRGTLLGSNMMSWYPLYNLLDLCTMSLYGGATCSLFTCTSLLRHGDWLFVNWHRYLLNRGKTQKAREESSGALARSYAFLESQDLALLFRICRGTNHLYASKHGTKE